MPLTAQTKSNYRVQLRKLWEIYKLMPDTDERKEALLGQIQRMCDKLGYEVDRLDVILFTTLRGRPRLNPDVTDVAAELKARKEDPDYWTPAAIDASAKAKMAESARKLEEMMKEHGGDTSERPKQATDDAKGTGSNN